MLQAAPGEEQELDDFRKELKELIVELQQVGCSNGTCVSDDLSARDVSCVSDLLSHI